MIECLEHDLLDFNYILMFISQEDLEMEKNCLWNYNCLHLTFLDIVFYDTL